MADLEELASRAQLHDHMDRAPVFVYVHHAHDMLVRTQVPEHLRRQDSWWGSEEQNSSCA